MIAFTEAIENGGDVVLYLMSTLTEGEIWTTGRGNGLRQTVRSHRRIRHAGRMRIGED